MTGFKKAYDNTLSSQIGNFKKGTRLYPKEFSRKSTIVASLMYHKVPWLDLRCRDVRGTVVRGTVPCIKCRYTVLFEFIQKFERRIIEQDSKILEFLLIMV